MGIDAGNLVKFVSSYGRWKEYTAQRRLSRIVVSQKQVHEDRILNDQQSDLDRFDYAS